MKSSLKWLVSFQMASFYQKIIIYLQVELKQKSNKRKSNKVHIQEHLLEFIELQREEIV